MNQDDKDIKRRKQSSIDTTFFSNHKNKVGERIKDAIEDETVKAFSRRCGVAESSLRDYISGKKKPGLDAITAISSFLGVTVDWLVTGKGIKYTRDLRYAQERQNGAPPAIVPDLPPELEPYRKRLDALLGYLAQIDDEAERDQILSEFSIRAENTIKLSKLEHAVNQMRAAYNKK